jgi:hypothetical protein
MWTMNTGTCVRAIASHARNLLLESTAGEAAA